MSKFNIMKNVTGTLNYIGLKVKKHSPEILMVAGITGGVTAAVMACKATVRAQEILKHGKEELDTIEYAATHPEECTEEYTEEMHKQDVLGSKTRTAVALVKAYAPSVILGVVSVGSIYTSNRISRKRIANLGVGYAGAIKALKTYRSNVVERFGEEIDKELRFGVKAKEIEETIVKEDGTEEKVKTVVNNVEKITYSDYARFFGPECKGWTKNPELNLYTVKQVEKWAQDVLEARSYNPSGIGTLFLNEVYDELGIDRTCAGQEVGWTYYRNGNNPHGDNYVDFGIYDVGDAAKRRFVNGSEPVILLDFNVDGPINQLLP